MARFVTPAGVEVEMSAEAAAFVGFRPVEPEPKPAAQKKTTRRKSQSDDE